MSKLSRKNAYQIAGTVFLFVACIASWFGSYKLASFILAFDVGFIWHGWSTEKQ